MPHPTINIVTVSIKVSRQMVGHFLHLMEYRADIHIIGRVNRGCAIHTQDVTIFTLRTDAFPADWNGREVVAKFIDNKLDFRLA